MGESADELRRRIREGLYFVGAGTFQELFEHLAQPALGFGRSPQRPNQDQEVLDRLASQQVVSQELLSRFSPWPIVLQYPDADETVELLESTGLNALAALVGRRLNPADFSWSGCGMRALEKIAAELVVARNDQLKRTQADSFHEKVIRCQPEVIREFPK
jgi:hypothetical protein